MRKFKEQYSKHDFVFLAEGKSNWSYFEMIYEGNDNVKATMIASIAKEGTGAQDCFFSSWDYFSHFIKKNDLQLSKHGLKQLHAWNNR